MKEETLSNPDALTTPSGEQVGQRCLVSRWDVCYAEHQCYPEPHFCREWDEDGGCYGTNPDHGMTWEEARKEVADWYQRMADEWRKKPEDEFYG